MSLSIDPEMAPLPKPKTYEVDPAYRMMARIWTDATVLVLDAVTRTTAKMAVKAGMPALCATGVYLEAADHFWSQLGAALCSRADLKPSATMSAPKQ